MDRNPQRGHIPNPYPYPYRFAFCKHAPLACPHELCENNSIKMQTVKMELLENMKKKKQNIKANS